MKRVLALLPAFLVVAQGLWIGPRFDRYVLPAFDGYVYDAMADSPRVFTLAPWGYRILTPWIVHSLPAPSPAVGFFWLNLVVLTAAVFLAGTWLRRLGFSEVAALLGGISLAVTPPLRAFLDYQVLVDPMSLLLIIIILNEFVNPHPLTLAALFALGALTKEVCLLPLAALPFVLAPRMGLRRALARSIVIAAPAASVALLLRATWGDGSGNAARISISAILDRMRDIPGEQVALLLFVTVLGVKGFLREPALVLRAVGTLLWFGSLFAVLSNPYGFAGPDLLRIAPFAWTPLLPLALSGLGFTRARSGPVPIPAGRTRAVAATGALLCTAALVLATDSYRRAPYAELPEPITYLGRSRETLKTARSLDEGGAFAFDSGSGRFAGPVEQRFNLTEGRLHRWFLFDGFGPDAVFESGAPEFREKARLLLPILTPRPVAMSLVFEAAKDSEVRLSIAGRDIALVPTGAVVAAFEIPASALVRGDNILTLTEPSGSVIRLIRFEARLEGPSPSR